ncbi:MAG: endonuclease III [Succinivibrio sp.]|jgi:endonuclease-3|nr:endonuclease III [Succinivibrio sp.]
MLALSAEFPNPRPALVFKNVFELLCAVVLSAQTTDAAVNTVTPALFKAAPDPQAMAALGQEGIAPFIKKLGLWRAKSKSLCALSKILCDKHSGRVPDDFKALTALPGVGTKTANVVLNVGFGHPTVAVDTHVFRVCCRTGLCPLKNAREVEQALPDLIPAEFLQEAHHRLLFHGRFVCTARAPKCPQCPLKELCRHPLPVKQKS